MKMLTLIAVLLLAAASLAAEPLLPVPFPKPRPQADAPSATSGGYYQTCAIAQFCLRHDGKWVPELPEPAAAEPEPKPPSSGGLGVPRSR
jgi:hypothetical protein